MNCSTEKVAPGASLRSPKLSTLLLSSNRSLRRIEDSFFQHMPALEILDLSGCERIQELPNSVSNLKNLIALVLSRCWELKCVPSLAELELLKRLDLFGTSIIEVPDGLERLVNLTYLDLDAEGLKVFPAGILPQLRLLQFLKIYDGVNIKGEELGMLERLSTFKGKVIFDKATRFNLDVDAQSLKLDTCYGIRNLCDVLCLNNAMKNLNRCQLWNLRDLEVLFELRRGENAIPSSLDASAVGGAFSGLKVLSLLGCLKIKMLFHPSFLSNLRNLQEIYVSECNALQEIVAETISQGETSTSIEYEYALPNLTTLSLWGLPQLKSICAHTIACPSLCEIQVFYCRQLKRMPLSLAPSSFRSIRIDTKEWWESAEWNHPNAKELLKPYLNWD